MSKQDESLTVNNCGAIPAEVTRRHMMIGGAATVALMSLPSAGAALSLRPAQSSQQCWT